MSEVVLLTALSISLSPGGPSPSSAAASRSPRDRSMLLKSSTPKSSPPEVSRSSVKILHADEVCFLVSSEPGADPPSEVWRFKPSQKKSVDFGLLSATSFGGIVMVGVQQVSA